MYMGMTLGYFSNLKLQYCQTLLNSESVNNNIRYLSVMSWFSPPLECVRLSLSVCLSTPCTISRIFRSSTFRLPIQSQQCVHKSTETSLCSMGISIHRNA